ncbi:MAG: hypothetical protein R2822_15725 [Spirosomataceae bacterium]
MALIGIASVFYTYNIVENLDVREQRQLTVFAQLIEYQANHPDLNEDYTALFEIVRENIRQSRIPTILVSEDKQPTGAMNLELDNAMPELDQKNYYKRRLMR